MRLDGERKVVDRTAATLAAALTDDLFCGRLEDVQGGPGAEVEDLHPGVVVAARHLERHGRFERRRVERDGRVHVRGEGGDVVEAGCEWHVGLPLVGWAERPVDQS